MCVNKANTTYRKCKRSGIAGCSIDKMSFDCMRQVRFEDVGKHHLQAISWPSHFVHARVSLSKFDVSECVQFYRRNLVLFCRHAVSLGRRPIHKPKLLHENEARQIGVKTLKVIWIPTSIQSLPSGFGFKSGLNFHPESGMKLKNGWIEIRRF